MQRQERTPTEQEEFWKGAFGDSYSDRNQTALHKASCLAFFSRALARAQAIPSAIEFGANVGLNLHALQVLFPGIELAAVEINAKAAETLQSSMPDVPVYCKSFLDFDVNRTWELAFVKGVLIHIAQELLQKAYEKIYSSSHKYILIAEYYNPSPVEVTYRGHSGRLFKRDFAGEMLDTYPDLELVDYGFVYHRDPAFPQDDITSFLLRKRGAA